MHAHLRPSLLVLTGLGVLLLSGCAKATVSATLQVVYEIE